MFYIDNFGYSFPCDIERKANIMSTGISGYLMSNEYFNDVLATYMEYTVTLVIPKGQESSYYGLYEKLSNPQPDHIFQFPYNGSYIQFRGRIEIISDKLYFGRWRNIKFTVKATEPSKVREE